MVTVDPVTDAVYFGVEERRLICAATAAAVSAAVAPPGTGGAPATVRTSTPFTVILFTEEVESPPANVMVPLAKTSGLFSGTGCQKEKSTWRGTIFPVRLPEASSSGLNPTDVMKSAVALANRT